MTPRLIEITQNDFGMTWGFTLTDGQGNAQIITGGNLYFSCQLQSDPFVNFSNAMVIDDGPNGKCHYSVQATDFQVPGTYNALIKLQFGTSEVASFSGITVQVDPIIPT
jgi:hypothetical protein